jgi:UDP-2-acetamido-3-amino-2,3-dideoxy-glucuronate N-acetyltransferase
MQYIYSHRLDLGKVRREESILWGYASHDISMVLGLVGLEPSSVTATGYSYLRNSRPDVMITHLSFPCGQNAHIFVSWLHPFKERKLIVVAEDGMAIFDDQESWDRKLVIYPHRIEWQDGFPVSVKTEGKAVPIEPVEPLYQESLHFLECILGNEDCRTDGQESVCVLRVLESAERDMIRNWSNNPGYE